MITQQETIRSSAGWKRQYCEVRDGNFPNWTHVASRTWHEPDQMWGMVSFFWEGKEEPPPPELMVILNEVAWNAVERWWREDETLDT